ncbi:MAG TPA: ribosome maturation factor RimP [Trebonia sp.]|nr:ribosome maturation factor RimP [Trebonia sp.]
MPGGSRSAVGPVNDKRLAELIEPVIAASGMDLESVRMSVAGKRRLLRIVVDGDHGVSLDDAADVSREISAMLDQASALGEVPYTLEVSSPGVDRPLTEPRHWRRAVGRLVKVKVTGEGTVEGRILAADSGGVTLDLAKGERRLELAELGAGAIQIEFGRIPDAELDEAEAEDEDEDEDPDLADEEDGDEEDDEDLGAGGDGH